jgi:ubiquinone/menaquinone biosynthesis C-methylase UbiE
MKLLSEDKLIWSPTVANSRMNRGRNSSGINSYEQDIHFKPEDHIQTIIDKNGCAFWLDLCCGEGRALVQVYQYFAQANLADKIKLVGIDLVDVQNRNLPVQIKIYTGSILNFIPNEKFDLVTCIHGLHYVGDKLKMITKACSLLNTAGLFIANLDLTDISIEKTNSNAFLKSQFRKNHLSYDQKKRILEKHGGSAINFNCEYMGADDDHGTNYTGQESVKSYYSL